jgi:hypothetical protein
MNVYILAVIRFMQSLHRQREEEDGWMDGWTVLDGYILSSSGTRM